MPSGLLAAACSIRRAMSAMSPVGGLRYSTSAPTCLPARAMPFLMVFHHESLSGAWLTRIYFSPSANAGAAVNGATATAAASASTLNVDFITSSRRCKSDVTEELLNNLTYDSTTPKYTLQPVAKSILTLQREFRKIRDALAQNFSKTSSHSIPPPYQNHCS